MSKLRVHMNMSLDGYAAGPNQSVDNPLGEGGERIFGWMYPLKFFCEQQGRPATGGKTGTDDDILREAFANVGAHIMGRNMFGGGPGPWKGDEWKGWWGDNPPYHHAVFVLTRYAREPLAMEGGTTFHFVTDGIESALRQAQEAAGAQDIMLAGGANVAQQYVAAGLCDEIDLHLAPLFLGAGERLFESLGPDIELEHVRTIQGEGATHLKYRVVKKGSAGSAGQATQSPTKA
jgi:dihydrofolate reductase